jgi:hypothetical protein
MITTTPSRALPLPRAPRAYRCQCGRPVFFPNSKCLACGTPLGYVPERSLVLPLSPVAADRWREFGRDDGPVYRRCANFDAAPGCNWLLPAGEGGQTLCRACRLNRTIPDQSDTDNQRLWHDTERAKRRLVSQLIALNLPVRSKVSEDPARGLAFDLLKPLPGQPVMTGHADGIITINVEEADDATRERVRSAMHEPYRTLLGHFRHEVGHYYWTRLVETGPWLDDFRALFGDERRDYAEALKTHYDQGPPADWALRFVSAYAASHPWEDWAETWAHYLHLRDALDTAASFGLDPDQVALDLVPWGRDALWQPDAPQAEAFLASLNGWVALSAALNELSRSMGLRDFYPFVLPRDAVAKLQFVHCVVERASGPTGT